MPPYKTVQSSGSTKLDLGKNQTYKGPDDKVPGAGDTVQTVQGITAFGTISVNSFLGGITLDGGTVHTNSNEINTVGQVNLFALKNNSLLDSGKVIISSSAQYSVDATSTLHAKIVTGNAFLQFDISGKADIERFSLSKQNGVTITIGADGSLTTKGGDNGFEISGFTVTVGINDPFGRSKSSIEAPTVHVEEGGTLRLSATGKGEFENLLLDKGGRLFSTGNLSVTGAQGLIVDGGAEGEIGSDSHKAFALLVSGTNEISNLAVKFGKLDISGETHVTGPVTIGGGQGQAAVSISDEFRAPSSTVVIGPAGGNGSLFRRTKHQ
jgi:hypothetical protein